MSRQMDAGRALGTLTTSSEICPDLSADRRNRRCANHLVARERRWTTELGLSLYVVATHAWDVTGAIRAGCAAAFVTRPGMVLDPAGEVPDVVGGDLREVADKIIAHERAEFGSDAAP
jgi:hypothetical protein